MKKLDKLLITSFLGPFFITFFVVVFILLTVFMLKYFDEIIGKGLGFGIISQLIFYFSINMTTNALPLAVLLSSLMTFGNLGVHFELTAIKSSGVSVLRVMQPLFFITCLLVVLGFYNNNYLVPKANLEAFSLLYDIKQKKPAMDIKQGVFYNNIPGYSIKINERFPDGETLKDIIIYEHIGQRGNKMVILADSGKMYNILDNRYLIFELFNGKSYSEQQPQRSRRFKADEIAKPYFRSIFESTKMVFDLSEFDLKRTKKELFNNNRLMKNINQLRSDLDSMNREYKNATIERRQNTYQFYAFHMTNIFDVRSKYDTLINTDEDKFDGDEMRYFPSADTVERMIGQDISHQKNNSDSFKLQSENPTRNISMQLLDSTTKLRLERRKIISSNQFVEKNNESVTAKEYGVNIAGSPTRNFPTGKSKISDNTEEAGTIDTLKIQRTTKEILDSLMATPYINKSGIGKALNHVRFIKGNMSTHKGQLGDMIKQIRKFDIERYKKLAMSLTILAMFLVGAPLGAIVKKGGLGMPVLFSIFFFVLFYIVSMLGEKWARQGLITPFTGVWLANMVLFPIGFMFLNQARRDAKLFDGDFYRILFTKLKKKFFQPSK